jgi:phosphoribosylformylglycinamidine synthase
VLCRLVVESTGAEGGGNLADLCFESTVCVFQVRVSVDGDCVVDTAMVDLRDVWEETSFVLERRQTNVRCVEREQAGLRERRTPPYQLTFDPNCPPLCKATPSE